VPRAERGQRTGGVARDTWRDYSEKWLALTLGFLAATGACAQETYAIDGSHTVPMFEVRHEGMSMQRGFFTNTQGKITLDRTARTGSIDVEIGTGSVLTASKLLNDVLKGVGYFRSDDFPTMRYVARDIAFEGDAPVAANGQLTLLGVTRPVTLLISDFRCGSQYLTRRPMCAAQATATIRRSEFGMQGGLPNAVADEVRIVIPVEAVRQ
jgi:polyisoprenoid-binding protein YceI